MLNLPDASRRRCLRALVGGTAVLAAFSLASPAQAADVDPAAVPIRAFYDALLEVMKQADKLGVRGRYDKLNPVIRKTFDLDAMTRIAIGPEWTSIAPDQQKALIDAFSRMTIATYANRFNGYSGESFEIDPEVLSRATGRVVRTRILRPKDEPVTLNYLMRESGGAWKIVDIYLSGTISELATKRSEFGAILKSGGPSALIESLREQADKLMKPG
ncbi:MAG TPA: ABC transporter substrate-binding protein [Burkholderiales bacterium]|nr:ABC transporter substrate-binding protein [Burkholderiales bacterium]